jgi:hypothetical protein
MGRRYIPACQDFQTDGVILNSPSDEEGDRLVDLLALCLDLAARHIYRNDPNPSEGPDIRHLLNFHSGRDRSPNWKVFRTHPNTKIIDPILIEGDEGALIELAMSRLARIIHQGEDSPPFAHIQATADILNLSQHQRLQIEKIDRAFIESI